jgi:general secretion pathway protein A
LIVAYAQGQRQVDERTVVRAATETFGDKPLASTLARQQEQRRSQAPTLFAIACGIALAVAAGVLLGPRLMALPQRATSVATAPAAPTSMPPAAAPRPPAPAMPAVNMPLPSIDAAFSSGADEATAWRALAGLWGSTLVSGEPCDGAGLRGLQCFRSRGGLAQIRLLDRPGILKLVDDRGRVAHVLLTGMADDSVTMVIAGVERSVPLPHLARLWRGDFATLWQTPPGYREGEAPANGSALWRWLTERLADVDRQGPVAPGEAALRARIFAFQLASGLTPDGLAGPLTLMQLNRASGMPEPRLKTSGTAAAATSGSRPS